MKPVDLVERAINNSSQRGAIVLDAFGGSGSTLIACQKSGRTFISGILELKNIDCALPGNDLRPAWEICRTA